ncbi:FAD-dependent oxidoreductase [Clostridium sp.]|uniref:FAD-dependent oxidoreductase n=1 Tax=Clostridium sp. TaxID=1506 RepID=UPI003F37655D
MKSLWSDSCEIKSRKTLDSNIEAEVVVIGAGIAGLLIAHKLKAEGVKVVVIEANKIASGNIKDTTAKITSQHNLIYSTLVKEFGKEKAMEYALANELAIKEYKKIINDFKIDCDFEEKDAYIYSLENSDEFNKELDVVKKLGIDAEVVYETKLPFKIKAALKYKNQAQFNPIKFLKVISEDIKIYEDTRAIDIKDNTVITNNGNIKAKKIVVATHFPFLNMPGFYFMRMHQERSYVLALEGAKDIDGMYIDISMEGYSFRNYNDLLIIGGIPQRTGKNEEGGCYEKLREKAKELYPNAKEKYSWSSQDCMTMDGIPYIGVYSLSTPNIYVATGFNKWGMTNAMVSAMIISDEILGRENNFSEIFSPRRFDATLSFSNLMKDGMETTKNFIAQRFDIPNEHIDHIPNRHGGIIEYKGEKVGVYKDNNGKAFIVTTKCPHLGCELKWNADELSWDCPCHGSRFDYKGNWLDGPATRGLKNE